MKRFILLLCLYLPFTTTASEEARARSIIDEMEQLYRGDSSDATITMEVETPQYQRTLKMTGQSLGKELAFFRILSPKKDRGVATLKRDEEMWNYFPKINKVIKVPPSMMMGSWMGSDFTNDDLVKETQLIDAYHLSMTEDKAMYRVTLTPKEQTVTVWGKIDYVISKDPLLPVSQSFYDEDGEKIRELTFLEPREYEGKLMPSILEMTPLNKEGHKTRIIYDAITFNVPGITKQTFSMRNLKSRF
ncbi:MAG: outer membrane lipoprotein-sorting protein [Pseudomonadales bacterium]|nr:outer membrane lipoprotein-sorting protein [Pseudomonadales bacterium]MBO6656053.1 outer membrane lipoprotein-sorting protein [Pseudomonadales bacterium]MBO6703420.1 outer membrane lipoprotein-sorting protein [Pseudomonadales bacterium]MBO7004526.1 outer membrane lipoprotein-sorting protein [Pseudomonadales bacterium]